MTFEYEHPPAVGQSVAEGDGRVRRRGDRGRPRFSFVAEEITEHKRVIEALREANRSKDEFLAMLGHELRNPLSPIVTALHSLEAAGRRSLREDAGDRRAPGAIPDSAGGRSARRLPRHARQHRDQEAAAAPPGRGGARDRDGHAAHRAATPSPRGSPLHLPISASTETKGGWRRSSPTCSPTPPSTPTPAGSIVVEAQSRGRRDRPLREGHRHRHHAPSCSRTCSICSRRNVRPRIDRQRGPRHRADDRSQPRRAARRHRPRRERRTRQAGARSPFGSRPPPRSPLRSSAPRRPTPVAGRSVEPDPVVDDNEDALELLAELLARRGARGRRSPRTGRALSRSLETFHPDVAILDIGLPVMDGYELADRIRERARRRRATADRAHRLRTGVRP